MTRRPAYDVAVEACAEQLLRDATRIKRRLPSQARDRPDHLVIMHVEQPVAEHGRDNLQ